MIFVLACISISSVCMQVNTKPQVYIFLRYERVFNRARKAATSATHIKVIARVICITHSPHLFSAKSRIPPNCSPCREKNLRGRYWNFGISVSIYVESTASKHAWQGCKIRQFPETQQQNIHHKSLQTAQLQHLVILKVSQTNTQRLYSS